ncbi:MAG: AAA family ATPase, partial [Candidatus Eremiobacteraeota bacterium]|nr:AAA family ATPase [Candidatus Eremiobacteraeota bacterium]
MSNSLFGRDRELRLIDEMLQSGGSRRTGFYARLYGEPGIGKTALLRHAVAAARENAWLSVSVACHPLRRNRRFGGTREIARGLLQALDPEHSQRYTSGLEPLLALLDPKAAPSDAAAFEIGLIRLLDGILADHAVFLALDDCQWLDRDSDAAIAYVYETLSDRSLGILRTERKQPGTVSLMESTSRLAFVTLDKLDRDAGRALVASVFPDADDAVVAGILEHGSGIPFDIVAIASQARRDGIVSRDEVSESLGAAISSQLAVLDIAERDFLEICSLLREPLDLEVLGQLFGGPQLEAVLSKTVGRYLVQRDGTLLFRHAKIADAVRSSLEVPLPQHRRILDALLAIEQPNLEVLERIVIHAQACGERSIARRFAARVAEEAFEGGQWRLASDFYSNALKEGDPDEQSYVVFFRKYTGALRIADFDAEAADVLRDAIRRAERNRLDVPIGRLAASLVATLCNLEDFDHALATYDLYLQRAKTGEERMELMATAAHVYAQLLAVPQFNEIAGVLRSEEMGATPIVLGTLAQAEALMLSRLGDHRGAHRMLDTLAVLVQAERSVLEHGLPMTRAWVAMQHSGCQLSAAQLEPALRGNFGIGPSAGDHYFAMLLDFAGGHWDAALQKFRDVNLDRLSAQWRAVLLAVPAAIATFSPIADEAVRTVPALLRDEIRRGHRPSITQLAAWWAAGAARRGEPLDPSIAEYVRAAVERPVGLFSVGLLPIAFAMYGDAARDRSVLETLADEATRPRSRWLTAHDMLARGHARQSLGNSDARGLLRASKDRFKELSAGFFAALAGSYADALETEDVRLFEGLGISIGSRGRPATRRPRTSRSIPTSRELDVARLISEGASNRQVAETLFLSERTV